jgi:hypothetical protein
MQRLPGFSTRVTVKRPSAIFPRVFGEAPPQWDGQPHVVLFHDLSLVLLGQGNLGTWDRWDNSVCLQPPRDLLPLDPTPP